MLEALRNLTAVEAEAVHDAIAQFVENGRDAVENGCLPEADIKRLEAAERVMARFDLAKAKLAARKYTVYAESGDDARAQFASNHPDLPILEIEQVRGTRGISGGSGRYAEFTITA